MRYCEKRDEKTTVELNAHIDKLNINVYNQNLRRCPMNISEQIRVLCVRSNISVAELARRTNHSPQSFSGKLKRESFTIAELEDIAEATGTVFERNFVMPSGDRI